MSLRLKMSVAAPTDHSESPAKDLEALIRSRTPLIVIETAEEPRVVDVVRAIAGRLNLKSFRWTVTDGLRATQPADQPRESIQKSQEILGFIKNGSRYSLFVLLDFHPFLTDPTHIRSLKDIALSYSSHWSTVLLVSARLSIPEELKAHTARFQLPLPDLEELKTIVQDEARRWGGEQGGRTVHTTHQALDLLARNLAGLTATDARRLVRKAVQDDGVISPSDLPEVMKARFELLGGDGLVTFEYDTAQFSDVGGLTRLRRWLEIRKTFFTKATDTQLDPPRGVLLL